MTMKYTHIGLQDQADALAGLRLTKICTSADWTGIGRVSGDVLGKEDSAGDSEGDCEDEPENEKTPSGEGVSSCCVSASQDLAVDVSSGGGGNGIAFSELLKIKDLRRRLSFLSDTLSDTLKRQVGCVVPPRFFTRSWQQSKGLATLR